MGCFLYCKLNTNLFKIWQNEEGKLESQQLTQQVQCMVLNGQC